MLFTGALRKLPSVTLEVPDVSVRPPPSWNVTLYPSTGVGPLRVKVTGTVTEVLVGHSTDVVEPALNVATSVANDAAIVWFAPMFENVYE